VDDYIILGVPAEDATEFKAFAAELGCGDSVTEQQYFDGAPFVDMLWPLAAPAAAWATVRAWIVARADQYKKTRITYKGVEIVGVSPKEAARIIDQIEKARSGRGAK
jgi:hypothetical protein